MKNNIIVYVKKTCMHCHNLTNWLEENDISYEQRGIDNQEYLNELKDHKGLGVPFTVIQGSNKSTKITGFDKLKLTELLM